MDKREKLKEFLNLQSIISFFISYNTYRSYPRKTKKQKLLSLNRQFYRERYKRYSYLDPDLLSTPIPDFIRDVFLSRGFSPVGSTMTFTRYKDLNNA